VPVLTAKQKQAGNRENDIFEIGYRYQTSDVAAAMGLAALEEFDELLALRRGLLEQYERELAKISGLILIGARRQDRTHAAWMCTIIAEGREALQKNCVNTTSSQARFTIETIDIPFLAGAGTIFRICSGK
jgi:dTDP-4-amino-4,6-dideoxygalactose transaminase